MVEKSLDTSRTATEAVRQQGKIGWPITIPIMAVILSLIFKDPIGQKIGEINSVQGDGKKWQVFLENRKEKEEASIPKAGQTVLTEAEVVQAFESAGYRKPEVTNDAPDLLQRLLRYGIVTNEQLDQLLKSSKIIDALKKIYVDELKRPADDPLDPIGIAEYGSFLFVYGVGSSQLQAVTDAVRSSQEYKEKHAS
jgi:hypothetical protein